MIGIGVFTSLGFQVKDLPSGFTLLMLWVVGGVVALCGALSYAELATAFPRSGGEYNFLSRIYHRAVGFIAGWVSATVGFTAPTALAAMAFGSYFAGVVPGVPPLALALALVWSIALVHLRGVDRASTFQNVSTFIKVALIVVFIVAAFAARHALAHLLRACRRGRRPHREPGIRGQPCLRHVLLCRLERRDLHRRRGARPAAHPAVFGDRRRGDGDGAVRGPQRRVPLQHARRASCPARSMSR